MRFISRFFNKSVYNKIIFGFLSVAIPLYVVSIVVIWNTSKKLSVGAQQSMEEKLNFFIDYMEDEIASINQMLVALNLDEELYDFYRSKQNQVYYDNFLIFNSLMNKLKIIHKSSDYISDVFIIFSQSEEEISVNYGFRGVPEEKSYILQYPFEKEKIPYLNSYINDDSIIYFINNKNEYILGINVSQKKIAESIKKYQLNYNFKAFLVDAKLGNLIGGDVLTDGSVKKVMKTTS